MEDYDTPDDFEVEINTATRKTKAPEADKAKKPKWKSGEIETLMDELEKRSCLRDVFGKDYHNRGSWFVLAFLLAVLPFNSLLGLGRFI